MRLILPSSSAEVGRGVRTHAVPSRQHGSVLCTAHQGSDAAKADRRRDRADELRSLVKVSEISLRIR
jgi:hypothetical protein